MTFTLSIYYCPSCEERARNNFRSQLWSTSFLRSTAYHFCHLILFCTVLRFKKEDLIKYTQGIREKKRPPNLKRLLMTSLCYEGHKVAFTTTKKKKTPPPWHLHLFLFGGCLLFLSAVCIHNLIYQLSWILQITCFVVQLPVRTRINNLSANISIKTKYIRHK